ncbi:MAG: hypothetical protein SQA66_00895 [Candidatus Fervidibacter sacchari]
MAKSKGKPQPNDKALLAKLEDAKNEVAQMFEAFRKGTISEDEFKQWWQTRVAFKGRGFLRNMLKQRELARGWDTKRSKSS